MSKAPSWTVRPAAVRPGSTQQVDADLRRVRGSMHQGKALSRYAPPGMVGVRPSSNSQCPSAECLSPRQRRRGVLSRRVHRLVEDARSCVSDAPGVPGLVIIPCPSRRSSRRGRSPSRAPMGIFERRRQSGGGPVCRPRTRFSHCGAARRARFAFSAGVAAKVARRSRTICHGGSAAGNSRRPGDTSFQMVWASSSRGPFHQRGPRR